MATPAELFSQAAREYQRGRLREAEAICRGMLSVNPNDASATQLLGIIVHRSGDVAGGIEMLRRAAALNPGAADIQANLGSMLAGNGRLAEAVGALGRAMELRPDLQEPRLNLAKALISLGNDLHARGEFEETERVYRRATVALPAAPEPHVNLGIALLELGRTEEAIASLRQAVTLQPAYADAWNYLGGALRRAGELDEAVQAYEQAVRLRPDFGDAVANLGNALRDRGQLDEAIEQYRKAMTLTAASWPAQSLVYSLFFHPDYDGQRILEEHRKWNETYARPLVPATVAHANSRDPDRRLRIGYVSPDFRNHCQANFTVPLLSNHDRERFEIFCYSAVRRPDEMTARIRALADEWRNISALSDDAAADLIRGDSIDVLVDLSMHMDRTRILVFARKPAPVQVTWLAYPGTTGLETMDYRLSDQRLDPPYPSTEERDSLYSERTIRLPDPVWCYDPLSEGPEANELPALKNGYITFGCLNNFSKITAPTLDLWASVIGTLPNSRLVVLTPKGRARESLFRQLSSRGINRSRIEPIDRLTREAYLAAYNRFDLCLDTFPYNGHTTTLDALWMGVPVVTLAGETAVSRGGLSILHNVNLPELVADSTDRAVEIARSLANDLSRLSEIRQGLRHVMQASPLMNASLFARNIEQAFRSIWREWCSSQI